MLSKKVNHLNLEVAEVAEVHTVDPQDLVHTPILLLLIDPAIQEDLVTLLTNLFLMGLLLIITIEVTNMKKI